MSTNNRKVGLVLVLFFGLSLVVAAISRSEATEIGREVAIPRHLQDGEEYEISTRQLIKFGEKLFTAMWTIQEGAGRPMSKGTGVPLSDPSDPLVFPRNFNRISGPDTNSCSGCHNKPLIGGGGDIVGNVFVLGQRFDFATFNRTDAVPTDGAIDEMGNPVTLQTIANSRKTIGMFGSGFIEMLARQITADLQAIRDATPPGTSTALVSKGISFGTIKHNADDTWDSSQCQGLAAPSMAIQLQRLHADGYLRGGHAGTAGVHVHPPSGEQLRSDCDRRFEPPDRLYLR
jgi:hypothetical protein